MSGVEKLEQPDAEASWIELRIDARRDTRLFVQRNVDGHVHVTMGKNGKATLILHPHAAKRLIANIEAVLGGAEFGAA
jgi:hypothetical protein